MPERTGYTHEEDARMGRAIAAYDWVAPDGGPRLHAVAEYGEDARGRTVVRRTLCRQFTHYLPGSTGAIERCGNCLRVMEGKVLA